MYLDPATRRRVLKSIIHRLSWCNDNCLDIAAHRGDHDPLLNTNHDTGSGVCIILPLLD